MPDAVTDGAYSERSRERTGSGAWLFCRSEVVNTERSSLSQPDRGARRPEDKKTSAVELTEAYIGATNAGKSLNCFITETPDR